MKTQRDIEAENIQLMLTRGMNELITSKEKESLSETKAAGYALPYYIGDLSNSLSIYSDEILLGKAKIKALPAKMLQLLPPLVVANYTVSAVVNSRKRGMTTIAQNVANMLETEYRVTLLEKKDQSLAESLTKFVQGTSYSTQRKFKMTDDLITKYHKDISKKTTSFKQLALKAVAMLCSTRPVINGEIMPPICYMEDTVKGYRQIKLASWFMEWLMHTTTANDGSMLSAYHTPLIEPPIEWTGLRGGGFHSERFKYDLIRTDVSLEQYRGVDISRTLKTVNRLQNTKWKVNTKILDIMESCLKNELGWGGLPKPYYAQDYVTPCPYSDVDKQFLTEEQKEERKLWRSMMAPHYSKQESEKSKVLMLSASVREAKRFKDYEAIYFSYFLDFRGRAYPKANALSPQGTDFVKALIHFSEGKEITEESFPYFCMHGANTFGNGMEKKTLAEKVQWVEENHNAIIQTATNPYNLQGLWHESDEEPWLFLAWCLEYKEYMANPNPDFKSHLAVAMDGSCNGLQHLSAMLFDEIGGESVNLTSKTLKGDIYSDVRDETISLLEENPDPLAEMLLNFGITRKACKRPVMIVPYAGTQRACRRYIDDQFKEEGGLDVFKDKYAEALTLYTSTVWQAIERRILKGREIMKFLSDTAKQLTADGETQIHWTTPNGFKVIQERLVMNKMRITTPLGNDIRSRGAITSVEQVKTDKSDRRAHATGIAPNFVHSLDACHLQETVNNMPETCSFAMIHDSFGVHVADSHILAKTLRQVFYDMYKNGDILTKFLEQQDQEITLTPPVTGKLDLSLVLTDEFFFS